MFANKELKAKIVWDSNKGSTWYFSKLAKSITTLCWKIMPVSSVLQMLWGIILVVQVVESFGEFDKKFKLFRICWHMHSQNDRKSNTK